MNKDRLYNTNLRSTGYIDGNAVRAFEPQRKERIETERRVKTEKREQAAPRENALPMSAPYVFFLIAVTCICIGMCVTYLNIQSNIRATRDNISQLRTNISTVQTENNALSYAINSYVDVNHICKVAKSKLGMKQASDNQIVTYKSSDSGYTLQYGDIPNK